MVWRSLISNQMSWAFDGNRRKMLKLSTFALTRCNTEHMVKRPIASIIKQQPLKLQTTRTGLSLSNLRLSTWYGSVLLTRMDPTSTRKLAMKPNPHVSHFKLYTAICKIDKVIHKYSVNIKFFSVFLTLTRDVSCYNFFIFSFMHYYRTFAICKRLNAGRYTLANIYWKFRLPVVKFRWIPSFRN